MMHELRGETESAEEIVFPDLIPLYGLSDIRGSSSMRNQAIVSDLLAQLDLALNVIRAAQSERPQPALAQLAFRLQRYVESMHPEMATEDESSILAYLSDQIEPLFDDLSQLGPAVAAEVERDEVEPVGERRRQVVPPVRVRTATVEQRDRGAPGLAPLEGVELDAREAAAGRRAEASAARVHGGGSLPVRTGVRPREREA